MDSKSELGRADERGEGSAITVMDALLPTSVQAFSAAVVSSMALVFTESGVLPVTLLGVTC
jgi:hypothetical protein